jgi:quercetin dioxygenase-like cupin family protein
MRAQISSVAPWHFVLLSLGCFPAVNAVTRPARHFPTMKIRSISSLAFLLGFVPALPAAEAPPTDVVVITHGKMDAAYAQGLPLLANSSYKISAGRRVTAPGQVEIHAHDTDILLVMEGTATFVTGGQAEGAKPSGEGEMRGEKITGGTRHELQKGDVVVVPNGVPHWFTAVSNPFLYFVVKVTK